MALYSTVVIALFAVLALWSIIEAGVATKVASEYFRIRFSSRFNYGSVESSIKTFRNGAALLAFDGFLTFLLSIGFLVVFLKGHELPPLVLLPPVVVLFLLWLGGAAAYSNGFNNLGYDSCAGNLCGTVQAAVAFAWLGWITLLLLLAALAYFLLRPPHHHDNDAYPHGATTTTTTTSAGGRKNNIFALGGLKKNKANHNTDVEKVDQHQQPIQTHPYPQQGAAAFPTAAPGTAAPTTAAPENAAAGYHGQAPSQQAFAGAYGVPATQQQHHGQEGSNTYDPAQAYAQQQPYEGQSAASPTTMPQPQQQQQQQPPQGWSVSPLGSQPQSGAAPTAEIVAGEPKPHHSSNINNNSSI